jgi:MFS family permease
MKGRTTAVVFLLGAGGTWNAGNVGPIAASLASDFSVTLGQVGLVSGTVFFGGVVAAGIAGAELARRIPLALDLRVACVLCIVGNIGLALSPVFAGLIAGRVIVGLGAGAIFLFGGGFARATGGVRELGVFGAGITLGIAGALLVGGLLEDAGIDWRVTFAVSAAVATLPLVLLPGKVPGAVPRNEPTGGLFSAAVRSLPFWRIALLGAATLGVPFVIGAWLVSYLTADDTVAPGLAGLISFALFGLSALMRYAGGRLSAGGASPTLVALGGCGLGAVGIAVLAIDNTIGWALVAILLIGLGLSVPSALAYDEAERVLPGRPLGGLGLMQVVANSFPIPVIPAVGAALENADPETAFLAMAAFVLLAGAANLRPPVPATATSAAPG